MKKFMKNEGFTLVELIVVIAILGILAAVAVPAYTGYIAKANDAAVITELSAIKTAADAVATENLTTVEEIEVAISGEEGSEVATVSVTVADDTVGTSGVVNELTPFYAVDGDDLAAKMIKGDEFTTGATWTVEAGWVGGVS